MLWWCRRGGRCFRPIVSSSCCSWRTARIVGKSELEKGARLIDVYDLLTIHPEMRKNYDRNEFTRDIHLLDSSGISTTAPDTSSGSPLPTGTQVVGRHSADRRREGPRSLLLRHPLLGGRPMTATLDPREWLDVVHNESLGDFIPAGGAAVKFCVSCDGTPTGDLARASPALRSPTASWLRGSSAAAVRIHMIDKTFQAVVAQVPWSELAAQRLAALAEGSFALPSPLGPGAIDQQIAQASGSDAQYVRMVLDQKIGEEVFKDRELARDFRIAMTWLCRARLNGGPEGETQQRSIMEWLTGEVPAISNMKQYLIYTKINRTNARHYFELLFTWARRCGRRALLS